MRINLDEPDAGSPQPLTRAQATARRRAALKRGKKLPLTRKQEQMRAATLALIIVLAVGALVFTQRPQKPSDSVGGSQFTGKTTPGGPAPVAGRGVVAHGDGGAPVGNDPRGNVAPGAGNTEQAAPPAGEESSEGIH